MSIINPSAHETMIIQRLKDDYIFLSGVYDVVGVFLFGSQNYETATVESDIDVKAIVMPKIDGLLFGNYEIKETHKRENGELTVYLDINFAWGSAFDGKNPIDYYNGFEYSDDLGDESIDRLQELRETFEGTESAPHTLTYVAKVEVTTK